MGHEQEPAIEPSSRALLGSVRPARSRMSMRGRVAAGVVGGLVGIAAAGVAAGVAAERVLMRRQRGNRPDPHAGEPFGDLPADEYRTVTTAEGVPLHVEINGPKRPDVTVVLVHGFCLDMGTFHFQRRALSAVEGVRV